MRLRPDEALHVELAWSADDVLPVGRLAWRGRRALFECSAQLLASGLEISPFRLPLRPGVIEAPPEPFDGLFGVFSDSLPDGWGRLLQDRRAESKGLSPAKLTPLDRLAWIGDSGIGALTYRPALVPVPVEERRLPLDQMAQQARQVLHGHASDVLPTLLRLGGSPHGARPKVSVLLRPEDAHVDTDLAAMAPDHRLVLVKFHSLDDPADAGVIELAYHRMAREAGIEVPRAWLLPSERGAGWFAVERFDVDQNQRRHLHTLCGLLHADHRLPTLDYVGAMTAVHRLTRDARQQMQMLRRMVFNVVTHNRDDHTKQTSLSMDRRGRWTLSPAYDLTWSEGPGGEHCMAVAGAGDPGPDDLLAAARRCGIDAADARRVIEEVTGVVTSRWHELAGELAISAGMTRRIADWVARWAVES